jgi:hypothetical protein
MPAASIAFSENREKPENRGKRSNCFIADILESMQKELISACASDISPYIR